MKQRTTIINRTQLAMRMISAHGGTSYRMIPRKLSEFTPTERSEFTSDFIVHTRDLSRFRTSWNCKGIVTLAPSLFHFTGKLALKLERERITQKATEEQAAIARRNRTAEFIKSNGELIKKEVSRKYANGTSHREANSAAWHCGNKLMAGNFDQCTLRDFIQHGTVK